MLASQVDALELVKQAQAGDVDAFAHLIQHYEREIYGYLMGMLGNREDAYDFTQQVFIKAWLGLGKLKSASCFKAWLYTIARNLTYDYWRGKKVLYQSWENLGVDSTVDEICGHEDRVAEAELVHLALAELPLKLRQCLLLGVVGGFSHSEIANVVGICETSVGTYISSARRHFRAIYCRLQNEQEVRDQTHEMFKTYTL